MLSNRNCIELMNKWIVVVEFNMSLHEFFLWKGEDLHLEWLNKEWLWNILGWFKVRSCLHHRKGRHAMATTLGPSILIFWRYSNNAGFTPIISNDQLFDGQITNPDKIMNTLKLINATIKMKRIVVTLALKNRAKPGLHVYVN